MMIKNRPIFPLFVMLTAIITIMMAGIGSLSWAKIPQNLKIVIIGDSLTEGLGISSDKAYPALFEKLLTAEQGIKAQVINGGVSGSTTATGLDRLRWYLKAKPTHIMIALGANDGLRGLKPQESSKNLAQMIEMAQAAQCKVILLGMKMPANYGKEYQRAFEQTFHQLAQKYEIPLIPFIMEGIALKKEFNQADGIHPNEKGHEVMAKTLWNSFKEIYE